MDLKILFERDLLMKKKLIKNLFRKLCIIIFLIYVTVIFIGQQQTLISYNSQKDYYSKKIDEAETYNETLIAAKDNLDSKEYIEAISREKLDMYSENERVYININK